MKNLRMLNIVALLGATAFSSAGQSLPGLYLTNAVVLTNGYGQFEVRTPDTNQPYVLLRSWAKDFCYGLPRWEVEERFQLDSPTNRYLITLPVQMSGFGSIFWRVAPLGQPMYWLSYSISSYGTLSNGLGVVSWPKQPDGWEAQLTVQNVTNSPAASEVFFTGPPGSGITNKPPDSDSGNGYKHYYYVTGPSAVPPTGNWHVQYGTNTLTFQMADPKVSSRYLVMVPKLVVSNDILTSISWTYHDPTTGVELAELPDYIAGSRSVTVSDTNYSQIYDSPPNDRWRTTYVFGDNTSDQAPKWSDVGSLNIGFQDNLGNIYSFYYQK